MSELDRTSAYDGGWRCVTAVVCSFPTAAAACFCAAKPLSVAAGSLPEAAGEGIGSLPAATAAVSPLAATMAAAGSCLTAVVSL